MRFVQRLCSASAIAAMFAFSGTCLTAQSRPADATGQCKDGTYTTAKSKRGACAGHGGVTTWFADASGKTKGAAKSAKKDAKDAGEATKNAAKDAGRATKAGAKTAAGATKEGAAAARDATRTVSKPADAPADATARCKDGTFSHAKQHHGACSGHGGVAEWYK